MWQIHIVKEVGQKWVFVNTVELSATVTAWYSSSAEQLTTNELSLEILHYISVLNYAANLLYMMCFVWLSESQGKSHLSCHGYKRVWFVSNVTTRISMPSTITRLPGMLQSMVCEWQHNQGFQLVATQPDERQAVLQYEYYINPSHDVSLLHAVNYHNENL
jgi:hypothetical protein